jgi:hypothetical protein
MASASSGRDCGDCGTETQFNFRKRKIFATRIK